MHAQPEVAQYSIKRHLQGFSWKGMMRARAIGSALGCCLGRPRPMSRMATGSTPLAGYQFLSRHFIFMGSAFNNCISYKSLLFEVLCSTPSSLPRPRYHWYFYEELSDVNCQLRGFDDDVDVFFQVIYPVHGFSVFHSTDQIVHHVCSIT